MRTSYFLNWNVRCCISRRLDGRFPTSWKSVINLGTNIDDEEYEKKIARLIVHASKFMRRHSPQQYEAWWAAIKRLIKEDHYILALNMRAGLRPPGDLLRLWFSGLVIVGAVLAVTLALAVLSSRYNIDLQKYGSRDVVSFVFWIVALVLIVVYSLIRFILGPEKLNLLIAKLMKKVAGHE